MTTTERNPDELILIRTIDAPIARVWRAWSQREALMQWWGQPKGATMPHCTQDFRIGGVFHYRVNLPDGNFIWGKGVYHEIIEYKRISFDDGFSDEQGNDIISAEFPLMRVEADFEECDGKTLLTIRHIGIASGTATVEQYKQGWSETLDRMEEALRTTSL